MVKVLVADAKEGSIELYRNILKSAGYTVLAASTSTEATHLASFEKPDAIILNELDGINEDHALAKGLRRIIEEGTGKNPLIIRVGTTKSTMIDDDWYYPYDLELQKPIKPSWLLHCLSRLTSPQVPVNHPLPLNGP